MDAMRWGLSLLVMGIAYARGRRTVNGWVRAADGCADFAAYCHFYCFPQILERKTTDLMTRSVGLLTNAPGDWVACPVDR